ncbi:MAG: UDP-N-acetylmuramate--L-alanine ligase [Bacteroidota bacterium]|nr:UDP-N-acetylmuramate--L-alanine ligase [Bacteroidota bacterium]MDP4228829.1 UDP-N-acetylmuramate--L-alanine ligase [Bacteroidota bacterium]MDP4235139.1 UDP-N-acetylmuramate--L-alanine ligase [Bacteroidota bacterium]
MPKVHFIGIGGAGMSGLAEILLERGVSVSGSDLAESEKTKELRKLGATIYLGHKAENISADTSTVVYTSAVKAAHNIELEVAQRRGIRAIRRAEFLADLTKDHKLIAVAGTHGKTTTTAMIAHVLLEAGLDPFVSVGARIKELGMKNARSGDGHLAVVEADEYDRSFLALSPFIAVLTTLEEEHLDIYKDIQDLQDSFIAFANRSSQPSEQGFAIINIDEVPLREILARLNKRIVTFGIRSLEAKYRASEINADGLGTQSIIHRGADRLGELILQIPGKHNVQNALAAIAVAEVLAIPFEIVRKALAFFVGAERRSQIIGQEAGILVIDDYAHHPTEIRATLSALRSGYPGRRLIAIFQPHTYSRTRDFAKEFAEVFAECADLLLLLDVYAAREQPMAGISSQLILDAARKEGMMDCRMIQSLDALPEEVSRVVKQNDIVVTLGAGSITEAAPKILASLKGGAPMLEKGKESKNLPYREKIA